jgi:hypothetical protein
MATVTINHELSFKIDEEFRSLIPNLSPEEYAQLEANILEYGGCRDPLVVWQEQGILLDGHNRYTICREHNITAYDIQEVSLPARAAAMIWILRNQLGRRNLCDLDRVVLALKLKPVLAEQAKKQQAHGGTAPGKTLLENSPKAFEPIDTRQEVATIAGVSDNTVAKATTILDHGTPSLIGAVREHQASIHAAAAIATLPEDEQEEIVARGKQAILETTKDIQQRARHERHVKRQHQSNGAVAPSLPTSDPTTVELDVLFAQVSRTMETIKGVLTPEILEKHSDVAIHIGKQCQELVVTMSASRTIAEALRTIPSTSPGRKKPSSPSTQPRSGQRQASKKLKAKKHGDYGWLTNAITKEARKRQRFTNAEMAHAVGGSLTSVHGILQKKVKRGDLEQHGQKPDTYYTSVQAVEASS